MTKNLVEAISLVVLIGLAGCQTAPQPAPKPKCSGKQSPDLKLCAKIVSVGKHGPTFNEDRVDIFDSNEHLLASKSFKSADGEHGRNVAKSGWTANSRFFVFSTASSGGHSPWHWQTYYYSKKTNTFKELDDTTGPIIKKDFQMKAPDEVDVHVQGAPSDPSDIITGTLKKVHLGTLP